MEPYDARVCLPKIRRVISPRSDESRVVTIIREGRKLVIAEIWPGRHAFSIRATPDACVIPDDGLEALMRALHFPLSSHEQLPIGYSYLDAKYGFDDMPSVQVGISHSVGLRLKYIMADRASWFALVCSCTPADPVHRAYHSRSPSSAVFRAAGRVLIAHDETVRREHNR